MCIQMQNDHIHTLNCPYLQGLIFTLFPTHPVPATLSRVNLTREEGPHIVYVNVGKLQSQQVDSE